MKSMRLLFLVPVLTLGLSWYASSGYAAHPYPVLLKDADGLFLVSGDTRPYSPKQTCGACHLYEASTALANKDHGLGSPSYPGTESGGAAGYPVPYPKRGVTTGFHFQQGRSTPWGDRQRAYYGLAAFTSSPGMYGKY